MCVFSGWSVSDKIALIICIVAFLQFLALVATWLIMRDTRNRQLRAYLIVTAKGGGFVPQDNARRYKFEFRVVLKNTGQTPAYEVVSNCIARLEQFPLLDNYPFELSPIHEAASSGILGADEQYELTAIADRMYTDEEIVEFKSGPAKRLVAYGTIYYKDAFGVRHYTNFSHSMGWRVDGSVVGSNTKHHNDAD